MKKMYYEEKLKTYKSDLKKSWQTLKEAIGKCKDKSSFVESLKINGAECPDSKNMAEEFNKHFTSMADVIAEKIVPTDRPPDLNHKIFNCNFVSSTIPISTDELLKTVRLLKSKTSLDINGGSASLLIDV